MGDKVTKEKIKVKKCIGLIPVPLSFGICMGKFFNFQVFLRVIKVKKRIGIALMHVGKEMHVLFLAFFLIQAMRETNSQFLPLGICERLFNFIKNSLIGRGLKRITMGHPLPQGSTQMPVDGSLMNGVGSAEEQKFMDAASGAGSVHYQPQGKSSDDLGDEIQVQVKETEDLENWTPLEATRISNATSPERPGGPKKSEIMEEETEEAKKDRKGKQIVSEDLTQTVQPAATQKKPPPRRHVRPRFSVFANVNQQSDEFIKSRKEAMERGYGKEPGNS